MELDEIRQIRGALGGSLNDVVLAIVNGAVRRFLSYRRIDVTDLDFRVLAPVSVPGDDDSESSGNRVSAWVVPLPLDESDPVIQLERIAQTTSELKDARGAVGAETLTQVAQWTPATLLSLGARNATRLLPFNLVVTNVPGPQQTMYLLGAPMQQTFPLVPLMEGLGLGIALFSYAGQLCWGFNADYDLVPDLDQFVAFVDEAREELVAQAARAEATPARSAS
jgi:WS/DGAT/MGAT family acyltransferase